MLSLLHHIIQQQERIMLSLQDITERVARQTTVETSAMELLKTLANDLRAANATQDQNAIAAIITQMDNNAGALANAVTANTPAQPAGVTVEQSSGIAPGGTPSPSAPTPPPPPPPSPPPSPADTAFSTNESTTNKKP